MSNRPSRLAFLAVLLFVVSLAAIGQTPGTAITDTSRKIIHVSGYEPTPGDVYTLSINYGINFDTGSAAQTENIQLILNADYTLEVPYVGTLNVRTLTFDELRTQVTTRVRERSYAQFVSLNLTYPAVFDILVWGGVANPGFRSVTSLTRLSDAVAAAGGTTRAGSNRMVELIRNNQTRTYDLVRYARRGDESQNPYIRPGDKIQVPLAETTVTLSGAIASPGTIEVLDGETIGDVIDLAGGLLPTALVADAVVTRIGDDNRYSIISLEDVDLTTLPARAGDIISIPSSTTTGEYIQVEGAIYTTPSEEGTPRSIPMQPVLLNVPYTPGMTVLGLLESLGGPTPFALTERSFIIRAETSERSPLPDLGNLWDQRQWDRDIPLAPGDRLVIPMMRLVVSVGGQVNSPGAFTFTSGYVVSDYLELAGGIVEEDGSPSRIYFVDADGTRTRVQVETPVPVGASIYVGRSTWGQSKHFFTNFFTVTGWVTGVLAVATTVVEFIQVFNPNWP